MTHEQRQAAVVAGLHLLADEYKGAAKKAFRCGETQTGHEFEAKEGMIREQMIPEVEHAEQWSLPFVDRTTVEAVAE